MGPVLVTGAAGFIGFHLTRRLVREGADVVPVDSFSGPGAAVARARAGALDGPEIRALDLTDRSATAALFDAVRPSHVVHLAARTGVRDSVHAPSPYIDANLVAFGNVLEGCRAAGVAHLLYASSSSVYGNGSVPMREDAPADEPVSLYAATKRANELMAYSYASTHGLRATGLRFFSVYGPWGRPDMVLWIFADALLRGQPLTLYGEPRRDMTYVDDVVESLVRLMGTEGSGHQVLNVGTGRTVGLPEVVRCLELALGCTGNVRHAESLAGDAVVTQADVTALRKAVGYAPDTSFEEGSRAFASWFLTSGHAPVRP